MAQNITYFLDQTNQIASFFQITPDGSIKIVKALDRDLPNGFPKWSMFVFAKVNFLAVSFLILHMCFLRDSEYFDRMKEILLFFLVFTWETNDIGNKCGHIYVEFDFDLCFFFKDRILIWSKVDQIRNIPVCGY